MIIIIIFHELQVLFEKNRSHILGYQVQLSKLRTAQF